MVNTHTTALSTQAYHGTLDEQAESLAHILALVRRGIVTTRPQLSTVSGYGRTLITQRLAQLSSLGLVSTGEPRSTARGRAPAVLHFDADRACVLVAELRPNSIAAAVCDLHASLISPVEERPRPEGSGLATALEDVAALFQDLIARSASYGAEVWGVGISVPAPVRYQTGHPIGSAITPLWEDFPVREWFQERLGVPVWVDNNVNLLTLSALDEDSGRLASVVDAIYVQIDDGISAGIVGDGVLHRGTSGTAGEIAHIEAEQNSRVRCYCGKTGCLVAIAGGTALACAASELAPSYPDSALSSAIGSGHRPTVDDLVLAARSGDPLGRRLLEKSAHAVGSITAALVNFHNPERVLLGGRLGRSGDDYLAVVREEVFRKSHALATRNLTIELSPEETHAGLRGGAVMVIEELFSRQRLGRWIAAGSPPAALEAGPGFYQ